MSSEYLGLTAEEIGLIFSGVQTLAIVIGVPYGLYQMQELLSSRSKGSVEKMLEEWRKDSSPRDRILHEFPVFSEPSVPERAGRLLEWARNEQANGGTPEPSPTFKLLCRDARTVVETLNDLGSYVELGVVEERHFFAQFHYAIICLVHVLEPYVVLRTALRGGNRWGMRLRRMREGAARYHHCNAAHRFSTIKQQSLEVVKPKRHLWIPGVFHRRWRYIPSLQSHRHDDEEVVKTTSQMLTSVSGGWGLTYDEMDKWFGPI